MHKRVGASTLASILLLTAYGASNPLAAQALQAAADPGAGSGVESIAPSDLERRIGILADDSMLGRDTPSPELVETAEYIAGEFESFGLRPGVGDSYLQWYPLSVVGPGPSSAQALAIVGPSGSLALVVDEEFVPIPVAVEAEGRGELMRVADLDAVGDAQGRVLAILVNQGNIRDVFSWIREGTRQTGAVGALLVVESDEYFEQLKGFFSGERMSLGEFEGLGAPIALLPASALPTPLVDALGSEGAWPGGWSASLRSAASVREERAMNTIGWLEGSDPELKREYVIFTAHMDHVGVGRPIAGDSIYNGADDDASGTATVVELAEAFATASPRPRRSLIFMTVSGEEKGLLGSQWYSEHPLFPLEQTVANVNIDMVGRNWSDTIVAIGKEESTLGPLVEAIAAEHPELDMVVIDDLWPEERFYFRSDHYNFARKGVPILFFFNGTHADYHRPSDSPDKIDYEKTARIGQLLYYLGLQVANADGRPEWDPDAYAQVVETDD